MELPPDQLLRIINRKGHFLLLSVSDDPIQFGKGAKDYQEFTNSYSSVQIFAESVAFTGDLLSPGGISISCHNIKLPSNGNVKIDTSGAKGASQDKGAPGDEAKAGGNGGNGQPIRFYVQNGSLDVLNHLRFEANGGRGGNAVVTGARTGDGGNGGSSIRIFQSCYTAVIYSAHRFLNQFDDEHSTKLPWTSDVGPHALIRAEASKFLLSLAALGTFPSELRRRIKNLHTALNADKCQVRDLVICVRFIRYELHQLGLKQREAFRLTAANTGGDPGSGDHVRPIIGNRGEDGKDTWFFSPPDLDKIFPKTSYPTADSEIRKVTIAFLHPEQCAMLLDRARTLYYLGSSPARLKADSVLQRLVDRLNFVDSLAETDPLYKVYGLEGVERFKSIKSAAKDCFLQLATGVGFNGRTDNWAPRLNYTSYKKILDDALKDHKTFEDTYRVYHTALSANQKVKDTISTALTQSEKMIYDLEENIQDLVHSLQDTEKLIKSLGESAGNAQRALKDESDRLGRLIKNDFELSVPQLMNAFTTFAFSPTAGMGAIQGANLLYHMSEEVPDINGQSANKDYVIGKMKSIEATATSIKSSVDKDIDGEFKLDDPLGTRLLAAEEDMRRFLADYAHSSFRECGEAVKTLFHEFVKAMQKRNDQVVSYNMQLKRYTTDKQRKKEYEAKRIELQDKDIDTDDPALLSATAYIGDIYQASRARIMQFLDNLVRSLNFRMLTTYHVLDFTSGGGDVDEVLLSLTHHVLVDSRSRIEATFGQQKEILGEDPSFFESKRLYLSESQLGDLKEKYTVAIKIPAMHKWDEDNPTPKTPFTGSCNIRIHGVRFGLPGLTIQKDADVERANVIVHITHSGKETIVDRNNKEHTFDHDPLTANYSYVLKSDGEIESARGSNGSWVSQGGSDYALPGLFPEYWVINLKNSETNVLDFGKVKEGYMDFSGTDYPFLDEEI